MKFFGIIIVALSLFYTSGDKHHEKKNYVASYQQEHEVHFPKEKTHMNA